MSQGLCLLSCITVCSSWSSLSPFAHLLGFLRAHIHSLHWVPTVLFSKCSNALIQNQFHFSPWRPPFRNPPASCLNLSDWSLEQLHTQLPSGNFPWPCSVVWSRLSIAVSIAGVGLASCLVQYLTVDPSPMKNWNLYSLRNLKSNYKAQNTVLQPLNVFKTCFV